MSVNTNSQDETGSSLPVSLIPAQVSTLQDTSSKKRSLQNLANLLMAGISDGELAELGEDFSELDIFDALFEREQLGSTAIGSGCAVPHGRISGISKPQIAILTLTNPLEFDSPDQQDVDILIGLLVPSVKKGSDQHNTVHLELLAAIASILNEKQNQDFLRSEKSVKSVTNFFIENLDKTWLENSQPAT